MSTIVELYIQGAEFITVLPKENIRLREDYGLLAVTGYYLTKYLSDQLEKLVLKPDLIELRQQVRVLIAAKNTSRRRVLPKENAHQRTGTYLK